MSARELTMVRTQGSCIPQPSAERASGCGVWSLSVVGATAAYRNVWLLITTAGVSVRVTASHSTPLGTMAVGSTVELAARLTGLVDVAADVFHEERAQLLAWVPETD